MRSLAAVVVVALALAAVPAAASSGPLPDCAYGSDVPGLTGYEQSAIERAAAAYDGDQPAFAAAAAAYIYGEPLETLTETVKGYVHNTLVNVDALATPSTQGVVSPNVDTAYSVAWIDLTQGPLVFSVPAAPDRFYTVQFLDAYTNAFAYVGYGSTGTAAGSYAIVPPGWSGTLPTGVARVQSPTNTVWLLGRTLVNSTADLPAVKAVQAGYRLTPLAAYALGVRDGGLSLSSYPAAKTKTPATGTSFIATLNQELTVNPPPAADDCALEALAPAGVGVPHPTAAQELVADTENIAGTAPQPQLSRAATAAVNAGLSAGAQIVAAAASTLESAAAVGNHGWAVLSTGIGNYGTDYLDRAIIGTDFLGANIPSQGIYPLDSTDVDDEPLTGARNDTITFPKGELPPAGAFWSLTVYGPDDFLYANAINRYAIGNRTAGLQANRDGSLSLYLQHAEPATAAAQANWLPVPAGSYHVILRLYEPEPSALDGDWKPPPIFAAGETLTPDLSHLRLHAGRLSYRDTQATRTHLVLVGPHGSRRLAHADRAGTNTVVLPKLGAGRYRVVLQAAPALYDTGASARATLRFTIR